MRAHNDNDRACYVYVICKVSDDGWSGPVKIGVAQEILSRVSSIQTGCPFKIDSPYSFECPSREIAMGLERSFHVVQAAHRLHGEWFDFHPIEAIHLLCIAYRTMVEATVPTIQLRKACLDRAGVFWAEKRFDLRVPTGALVQ